jgi:hypothetical protein
MRRGGREEEKQIRGREKQRRVKEEENKRKTEKEGTHTHRIHFVLL